MEELARVERHRDDDVAREIAALEERLRASRSADWSRLPGPELLADLESALLVPEASWNRPPARPGLGARIRDAFRRFLAWLRRLFSRSRAPTPARRERSVTLAFPSAGGRALGPSELGDTLARLSAPQREELAGRVESSIRGRERTLEREAEEKRKAAEAQRRRLEAERSELERRAGTETERAVRAAEEKRFQQELRERGYVAEKDGTLVVTYGLVERFARLLLREQSHRLPGDVRLSLKGATSTGIYEKARLARLDEIAHLDVASSLVAARLAGSRHIDESTSYVYREITAESVHVVVAFDRSGSMTEGGKLDAAKRALLALYVAVRNRYPDATVDLLAFDNTVSALDLLEVWECRSGAFTNTSEALRAAHLLLRSSRASRRELYLITDGLPEAYTDAQGEVRSGQLDRAMEEALERARELATVTPLRTTVLLLRSDRPEYEAAARALVRTLGGELVVTDPAGLGFELLVRWAHGTETERRIAPPAPRPPSPAAASAARGRRRRSDRRMGG